MEDELIQISHSHAERILLNKAGELGLLGLNRAYRQVWARDSMICGLGLWWTQDIAGRAIHARSLDTLRRFQSQLGKIPHNVGMPGLLDPALIAHGGFLEQRLEANVAVEDTNHAGCVDGNLWYILGQYFSLRQDFDMLRTAGPSLEKALLWLRYQDSNECGLLEVHEAMDWWEFNEWFHGLSCRPMGYAGQSWSAAIYLFAVEAVKQGRVPIFNSEHGWSN